MSDHDREHIVEPEAGVIEGDDRIPHQPAPPLDPYTPEPGPRRGEARAFAWLRLAWVPLLVGFGVLLWAALR